MASNFPQVGVSAVVLNAQQYGAALQQMAQQTTNASNQIKQAATGTQALDTSTKSVLGTLQQFVPQIGQVQNQMSALGDMFGLTGEDIAAIAVPIGIAAAGLTAFLALATRGAGFSDIQNGFAHLTAAAGQTADTLLSQLHNASKGTIDDMTLMTITNNALLGVNGQLQKSFGQDLPQMMSIADTVAKATGQDTVSVFDSISEAIKRGQTRGLQAIGIVVDQKQAYDDYAKSMDISVKSMTKADQEQALLNATLKAGKQVTDELGTSQESNATKMEQAGTSITNTLNSLSDTIQPVFGALLDGLNSILGPIADAINQIAPYIEALMTGVGQLVSWFTGVVGQAIGIILGPINTLLSIPAKFQMTAKQWFEGGAAMIGELAAGIINAANTYVFPAILDIATGIANFLSGMSPPPMGPLHTIDQGGANTMTAWLEGFTGVSLEPINQVASDVNAAMGDVANLSLAQVKDQLLQLDEAIAPFQEQLDLVKNQFTMIDNVTKPALDAIDKQISLAQVALANGSQAAAAQIKTLDAQKQALTDYTDQQQIAVDNAQIQLALAQMQQSSQRDALLTQQQMLQQAASLTTKTPATKTPGTKGTKGGKGAAAGAPTDSMGNPIDTSGATTDAGAALGDLQTMATGGFDAAGGAAGLATSANFIAQIQAQGNRIGSATSKIGDQLNTALVQPFKDTVKKIGDALGDLFGTGPSSISAFLGRLPGAFAGLGDSLQSDLVTPVSNAVQDAVSFFLPGNPKSLWTKIANFVSTDLPSALTGLADNIEASMVQPFITKAASIITAIDNFFNGDGDGTLHGVFDNVMAFLGKLPDRVKGALAGFVNALITSVVNPIITALNGVISSIEGFINNTILPAVNQFKGAAELFASVLPGGGDIQKLIEAASVSKVSFARIPLMGAAGGGVYGPMMVGERGPEMIMPAQQLAVFPTEFVTALDRLTSVLTRPSAASGNNSTVTNYNQQYVQFHGIPNAETAIMEFARMNAARAQ